MRRSIANIGVVIGQSTQLLYPGPGVAHARDYMRETTHGIYEVLLSGRFAFDFVHEDRLELDRVRKYRALLLPNIAMLSDQANASRFVITCAQVDRSWRASRRASMTKT